MIKAVAFDPGGTTGFATGEIEEHDDAGDFGNTAYDFGPMLVQTAQAVMDHKDIFEFVTNFKPDYIICERFDFRMKARTGLSLISREFIGVVELYTQMNEDCTLTMQSPGQVINGHFNRDKLIRYNLWRKGQIHANEAAMHLLYWAKFGAGFQYCKGEFKLKQGS